MFEYVHKHRKKSYIQEYDEIIILTDNDRPNSKTRPLNQVLKHQYSRVLIYIV